VRIMNVLRAKTLYQVRLKDKNIRLLRSAKNNKIYLLIWKDKAKIFFEENDIGSLLQILIEIYDKLRYETEKEKAFAKTDKLEILEGEILLLKQDLKSVRKDLAKLQGLINSITEKHGGKRKYD